MPTYEYKCKDCDEGFEVVQAFTDDALTTCPSCHGDLKKVFGSIGISFKGSGFYKNDARPGSSSTSASSSSGDAGSSGDSPSAPSTDTSSTTKTDSASTSTATSTEKSEKSKA